MNRQVGLGLFSLAAVCTSLLVATPVRATEANLGPGLEFSSDDKAFSAQVGGRIMQDWAFIRADDDAKEQLGQSSVDGTEIRRARLFMAGLLHGNVAFKAQFDFAGGGSKTKDLYMELRKLPFGTVRVGNFFEPFGLEGSMSSKYITFMERGLATTFSPGRNMGIMVHNNFVGSRGTWAAGVYRVDDSDGTTKNVDFAKYMQTGRITYAPKMSDDGTRVVHLGFAATHRRPSGSQVSYSVRPSAHLAGVSLSTGGVSAERIVGAAVEAAMVAGPISAQGEVAMVAHSAPDTDTAGRGDSAARSEPTFMAVSAEASYWLTGENRTYSMGTFGRVKPKKNFGDGDGMGAWQVAARVSYIDLDDSGVEAGRMIDITLGTNWHLNPNARIMLNYVMAMPEVGDGDGAFNIFQTRFQIDF